MNDSIDFYVPIIDNYWDIWFALNLALIMVWKNPKLKVRFFNDNQELFDKMIGNNKNNIQFLNLSNLNNQIPTKTIFTFFDYKLSNDYLKKWESWKTIIQFWYFLLHKWIENLNNTSYEIDWNNFIHFIPSLRKNTGWIIINKIKDKRLKTKEKYLNYINEKYNLKISKNLLNKKWISIFVYKDTSDELIKIIEERKNEVFFVFDCWIKIDYTKNIIFMPFLELLDYNDFLSICDCNIVRWENSLCTSLSYWKPTLWDIYKEDNEAHNEKINDFLDFLNSKWQYNSILEKFNSNNKKEAFTDFLDNYQNYINLFQNLWNYINNNCDLYKNLDNLLY